VKGPAGAGELIPLDRCPTLEADWRALEHIADGSPFTCWAWVSVWLRHLPPRFRPLVFRAQDDAGLFALGLLVDVPERGVRRLFGNRSVHLQETGDIDLDEVTIEYAGLLTRRGAEPLAYAALFDSLCAHDRRWRSLRISASTHAMAIADALPETLCAFRWHSSPSCFVDLAAVRAAGGDYIASLGSSTRAGLRKTQRGYEKLGALQVEVATEPALALAWLDELRVLHEHYWQGRGERGSFASAFFVDFHRDLLREGAAAGFTQLLRITAGPVLVGYLYNLVWRGKAYFYNAGLNYGAVPHHDRPGYLGHLVAIEKYLADGLDAYDFLAGDGGYKRLMSTHMHTLQWIDIRPRGWRLVCEKFLQALLRRDAKVPLDGRIGTDPVRLRD
jgi:CelD/BcsL family acetyltransferase involved in cellulose biosynthesis